MLDLSPHTIAAHVGQAIPHLACELRPDFLQALRDARSRESDERARQVLDMLLENAAIAARDKVPLCQDTGYVWVCLELPQQLGAAGCVPADVFSGVDAAVAQAYEQCGLRKSLLHDALCDRSNTTTNTPAFCEVRLVDSADAVPMLHVMLKGGGSDNASRLVMLPPGVGWQGVRDMVLAAVREKAANACPPLVVGVGVGGTFDKVAGLAKHALLRPLDAPNPNPQNSAYEHQLLAAVNATGVGPGGFGGDTTALAVHLASAPCHIAALPVAVNMGCSAMRSISIAL